MYPHLRIDTTRWIAFRRCARYLFGTASEATMKNALVVLSLVVFISTSTTYCQTLMDFVIAQRGDTLVIKDYADMGNTPNSLYEALLLDSSNVPAGRVYELQAGGWYPLQNNPSTSAKHSTVIVGSDPTMVVTNRNAASAPPLISGYAGIIPNVGYIAASGDLTIKNCALTSGATDLSLGWAFTGPSAPNLHLVYDNCLFEHDRWVFVAVYYGNCDVTLRNCYFVNMNGQPCRRNGGLFDCFAHVDTLLVENCTHINAQGTMYRFRGGWQFKRILFNHNTFVDCAGSVFMNNGYQSNVSLTNNLFVNCNVQPYPALHSIDQGEQDPDWLPMGLVNVYPDSANVANNTPRKFLVDNNLIYWDPSLGNVVDTVNQLKVNGLSNWQSQMILMNSRTKAMFDDNAKYPYLTEGKTYTERPDFTDPKDLLGAQLGILKKLAVAIVDTNSNAMLADWRLLNTGTSKYINPDWPIPVDLSCTNATLKTGATGGFPVGDVNWFPAQKATWLAQRNVEYNAIETALQAGHVTALKNGDALPVEFTLKQNYPNPFNPSTTIAFSLPHAANASLKVFDMLGREVATLVNGYAASGLHEVQFDATNLASGVYVYRFSSGNFTTVKKMTVVK
jgi:hypothetical protein